MSKMRSNYVKWANCPFLGRKNTEKEHSWSLGMWTSLIAAVQGGCEQNTQSAPEVGSGMHHAGEVT
jgi:hypothetical protein